MKFQVIRLRTLLLSAALIAALFAFCLLGNRVILSVSGQLQPQSMPRILIDPGHGGEDGGTQSADGILEKDINLQLSKKIEVLLQQRNLQTQMTRGEDALIYDASCKTMREKKVSDIKNRMAMIEAASDCLFLSIHQNYFSDTACRGTQVFYSPNNAQSAVLADAIQKAVVSAVQPENQRVIKPSGKEIYLLYHAQVPAVMVECGFLSNPEEAAKLTDEDYQNKIAAAIVDGVCNYLNNKQS